MRYDTEHKSRTRARVLDEAAATIRAVGPDGIGVAGLMAKVGLTHGGFYAHFKSKDDLVAEAIARMFEEGRRMFRSRTEGRTPADGLAHYIDWYLSPAHRDTSERGCPLPRLSGEVARLPLPARTEFAAGAAALSGLIAGALEAMGQQEPRLLASSGVSEMVGALSLARAEPDRERSDQILAASLASVKGRLGLKAD
jgi:TetR/AcrR family transcriptional repressor of nem operon